MTVYFARLNSTDQPTCMVAPVYFCHIMSATTEERFMCSIEESQGGQAAAQEMVVQSRSHGQSSRGDSRPIGSSEIPLRESCHQATSKLVFVANSSMHFLHQRSSNEIPLRESCQPTPTTSKLVLVANFPSNFLQRARQRRVYREELVV